MRQQDALRWGIVWMSEEEMVQTILARPEVATARRELLAVTKERPDDLKQAASAKVSVRTVIQKHSHVLSESDAKMIRRVSDHLLHCNFGKRHEAEALSLYESKTGWDITNSNEDVYTWHFPKDRSHVRAPSLLTRAGNLSTPSGSRTSREQTRRALGRLLDRFRDMWSRRARFLSPPLCDVAKTLWCNSTLGDGWMRLPCTLSASERRCVHELAEARGLEHRSVGSGSRRCVVLSVTDAKIDSTAVMTTVRELVDAVAGSISTSSADDASSSPSDSEASLAASSAQFTIVGMVDGVAHELDCSASSPDEWSLRPVVVEIKHRMRRPPSSSSSSSTTASTTTTRRSTPPPLYEHVQCVAYMLMLGCTSADLVQVYRDDRNKIEIDVHRLELDAPPYRHRQNWYDVVVPRLYDVASFVLKLRTNENERRRFVTCGSAVEQWRKLQESLPFIVPENHRSFVSARDEAIRERNAAAAVDRRPLSTTVDLTAETDDSDDDCIARRVRKRRRS